MYVKHVLKAKAKRLAYKHTIIVLNFNLFRTEILNLNETFLYGCSIKLLLH